MGIIKRILGIETASTDEPPATIRMADYAGKQAAFMTPAEKDAWAATELIRRRKAGLGAVDAVLGEDLTQGVDTLLNNMQQRSENYQHELARKEHARRARDAGFKVIDEEGRER